MNRTIRIPRSRHHWPVGYFHSLLQQRIPFHEHVDEVPMVGLLVAIAEDAETIELSFERIGLEEREPVEDEPAVPDSAANCPDVPVPIP